jgi:hypothetical protein
VVTAFRVGCARAKHRISGTDEMALRELIDEQGTEWVVFAVQPSSGGRATGGTRPEFAQGWLCFQSETERRRLAGVPPGWDAMDDGALLALLAKSPVAPRVRRARHR